MMPPELHKEYPRDDEGRETARLLDVTLRTLEARYLCGPQLRDTHAKGLAVVSAELIVVADLPEHLRVGLFAQPATYAGVIRFSNTDPTPHHDRVADMRAMSIKLTGVPGPRVWGDDGQGTLDLLLMSAKSFMTPTLAEFIDLQDCLRRTTTEPVLGAVRLVAFFLRHPSTARRVMRSQIPCANLLELPYFSETPYRFGDRTVQFRAMPRKAPASRVPGPDAPPNYLNERLRDDLATQDAWFDLQVHFQTDPVRMPIEDSSVEWSDALSPPQTVAALRIPAQPVLRPGPHTIGEDLSFNPWRTLPDHRPLGWVNRVRQSIYADIARFRASRRGTDSAAQAMGGHGRPETER